MIELDGLTKRFGDLTAVDSLSLRVEPGEPFVYPKLTGAEFLRLIGDLYEVPYQKQARRIPELLEMFELKNWGGALSKLMRGSS
ncbi:MAG: hypothetical protein V3S11_00650 [Elusimicrobiota bacterium]